MNDGGVYAYDDGMDQPICNKPACVSKWKQVEAAYEKGDDEGYKVYEKLFGAETEYASGYGENSAWPSSQGVPQWYGSAEDFGAETWKPKPECEECGAFEGGTIDGCDHCNFTYWFNGKVYHPDSIKHIGAETFCADCGEYDAECGCYASESFNLPVVGTVGTKSAVVGIGLGVGLMALLARFKK